VLRRLLDTYQVGVALWRRARLKSAAMYLFYAPEITAYAELVNRYPPHSNQGSTCIIGETETDNDTGQLEGIHMLMTTVPASGCSKFMVTDSTAARGKIFARSQYSCLCLHVFLRVSSTDSTTQILCHKRKEATRTFLPSFTVPRYQPNLYVL
jgi:hypothetical protein